MRPLYLKLKGFKGIKSGIGLDEIEIDFTKLPEGLIVFDAPNGSGKTTILDSMTPYRIMPYRSGNSYSSKAFSYYDNTYGDSCKEFIFEMNPVRCLLSNGVNRQRYRSLINIDTDRKKQEAFLFTTTDHEHVPLDIESVKCLTGHVPGWEPINKDGKIESYDQAVEEILGSPKLFFTSIFRCQGATSLSDYTKGDIKELFAELLCIDEIKVKSEKAKRIKSALIKKLDILSAEKTRLESVISDQGKRESEYKETLERIETTAKEILSKEKEIRGLEEQIQALEVKLSLQREALKNKAKIEGEIQVRKRKVEELLKAKESKRALYNSKYKAVKVKIDSAKKLIEKAPALRKKVKEEEALESEIEFIKSQVQSLDEQYVVLSSSLNEFGKIESEMKEKEKGLQNIRLSQKHAIEMTSKALMDAEKKAEILKNVPCTGLDIADKCMFVKDAAKAKGTIASLKAALSKVKEPDPCEDQILREIEELKGLLAGKESVEDQIKDILKQKESFRLKTAEKELKSIREYLKILPEVELAERSLPEYEAELQSIYDEGKSVISELESQVKDIESEIESLQSEAEKIVVDEGVAQQRQQLQAKVDTILKDLDAKRGEEALRRHALGGIEEGVRQIERAKEGLITVSTGIGSLNTEISEWALLEKALGNDGLIALEIDDAGPAVSSIANELLLAFGPRFTVRIDTQGMKADGKSVKETFDITVFDAERNEVKSIRRMSGGERTWIEDAITKAICIYNKGQSNRTFLTIFTDEKDLVQSCRLNSVAKEAQSSRLKEAPSSRFKAQSYCFNLALSFELSAFSFSCFQLSASLAFSFELSASLGLCCLRRRWKMDKKLEEIQEELKNLDPGSDRAKELMFQSILIIAEGLEIAKKVIQDWNELPEWHRFINS